jgi:hypothetical protein
MTRQTAAFAFVILFFGLMFLLVATTDIGWLLAGGIGIVVGGVVAGFIAERSRG